MQRHAVAARRDRAGSSPADAAGARTRGRGRGCRRCGGGGAGDQSMRTRGRCVDVVASRVDFIGERSGGDAGARDGHYDHDDSIGDPTRVMPPGSPGVTHSSWSRSKRLDKKREKKRLETEARGLGPDTDERYDAEGRRETLRGLRVGERVGKMRKFPPLGSDAVTWVDDARGIDAMRTAVLDPSTRTRDRNDRYDDDDGAARTRRGWWSGRGVASAQALAGGAAAGGGATRGVSWASVADATRRRRQPLRPLRRERGGVRHSAQRPRRRPLSFGFEYDLSGFKATSPVVAGAKTGRKRKRRRHGQVPGEQFEDRSRARGASSTSRRSRWRVPG